MLQVTVDGLQGPVAATLVTARTMSRYRHQNMPQTVCKLRQFTIHFSTKLQQSTTFIVEPTVNFNYFSPIALMLQ
jgi:hypothetical protein